jgi:uncharacterized protein YyaL (SSP411 family)
MAYRHFRRRQGTSAAGRGRRAWRKLFAARERPVRPCKDDRTLNEWNGLMIAALAKAARGLHDAEYAATVQQAAGFVLGRMRADHGPRANAGAARTVTGRSVHHAPATPARVRPADAARGLFRVEADAADLSGPMGSANSRPRLESGRPWW